MALCVTRKVLPRIGGTVSNSAPSLTVFFGNYRSGQRRKSREVSPLLPLLHNIQASNFHHQTIIRFHIQTARGILLEALQKSHKLRNDYDIHELKIPDDLKRLKSGSLKWLFSVWPSPQTPSPQSSQPPPLGGDFSSSGGGGLDDFDKRRTGKGLKSLKPSQASTDQLHAIVDYLKSRNIAIRRLIKLPWLLSADPVILEKSTERVQNRLNLSDFSVAISFVNIVDFKLTEAAIAWSKDKIPLLKLSKGHHCFKNRIDYLSHRLNCQKEDIADMMSKVNIIMTMPLEKIEDMLITLLDEGGIHPESVVNDPWVFIHSLTKMKGRIHILQEKGLRHFKPWVLRASQRTFERFTAKELQETHLLAGHSDIKGFLQEKLNCSKQMASAIVAKVPSVKTATAVKLNEMIDFLYSRGFSAMQICETPRVLGHSVDTISMRLDELSGLKEPALSLHLLCRTNKDYRAILRKLKGKPAKSISDSV